MCVLSIEIEDLIESLASYFTSLLGVNVTAPSSAPSVTLTPYQFENAMSQLAAQLIWIGMRL